MDLKGILKQSRFVSDEPKLNFLNILMMKFIISLGE